VVLVQYWGVGSERQRRLGCRVTSFGLCGLLSVPELGSCSLAAAARMFVGKPVIVVGDSGDAANERSARAGR
jgi:hypothetical protein